jgi:hypothetical protein
MANDSHTFNVREMKRFEHVSDELLIRVEPHRGYFV